MSHTNPRADRRPLGNLQSRRGLDEKMFFLIFTPWPSTKILADPGLESSGGIAARTTIETTMTDCGPPAGFLKPTWSETREHLLKSRGDFSCS